MAGTASCIPCLLRATCITHWLVCCRGCPRLCFGNGTRSVWAHGCFPKKLSAATSRRHRQCLSHRCMFVCVLSILQPHLPFVDHRVASNNQTNTGLALHARPVCTRYLPSVYGAFPWALVLHTCEIKVLHAPAMPGCICVLHRCALAFVHTITYISINSSLL